MQNAPRGAFCNTFDLHLATICQSLRYLLCLFFEWPFYTGFTQVLEKLTELIEQTFNREGFIYLACNDKNAFFTSEQP